jgi:hypothetical protein
VEQSYKRKPRRFRRGLAFHQAKISGKSLLRNSTLAILAALAALLSALSGLLAALLAALPWILRLLTGLLLTALLSALTGIVLLLLGILILVTHFTFTPWSLPQGSTFQLLTSSEIERQPLT